MDCEEGEGMRIRTVKEDFWKSETMASVGPFSRLAAIALLNFADDKGFFILNIPVIRGALFPFEEDSRNVLGAIKDLSRIGYIRTGKSEDGKEIGHIVNFSKHQRIDKPQASKIEGLAVVWSVFQEDSKNVPGAIPAGMERKGVEKERRGSISSECELIYQAYPKHTERPEALAEIERALKVKPFDFLLEAVQAFAIATKGQNPKYIVSCGRWMKRQRWDDDRSTWVQRDDQRPGFQKPQPKLTGFTPEYMEQGRIVRNDGLDF